MYNGQADLCHLDAVIAVCCEARGVCGKGVEANPVVGSCDSAPPYASRSLGACHIKPRSGDCGWKLRVNPNSLSYSYLSWMHACAAR
eukprot:1570412-Amphidinium_carterae.1